MQPDDARTSLNDRDPASWLVSLYLAALGLWFGSSVFMSAGVLPTLFLKLEPADAGRIAALIFPLYFQAGLALGLVCCLAALLLSRTGGRRWLAVVVVLVCMTAAQGWSALVIHPEMAQIRGVAEQVPRFQELHQLSVRLNAVVLGGGLLLVAASGHLFAFRRERS